MTHRLTTNYAKNYCNRTLIVKVIVENVVTCFFWDTVYRLSGRQSHRTKHPIDSIKVLKKKNKVIVNKNVEIVIVFAHTYDCIRRPYSSTVGRFMSNYNQNDQRPILHISSNTFHQRKCFVFCDDV